MVRVSRNKAHFSSPLVPLFGILTVLVIAATYYMANSSGYFDDRSKAAGSKTTSDAQIAIVEPDPHLGGTVHFTYVLPNGVKEEPTGSGTQARIQTMCYQDEVLVYGAAQNAIEAKTTGELLGGGSSNWKTNGGPANCVSTLYQWSYKGGNQQFVPFATTSFNAAGM